MAAATVVSLMPDLPLTVQATSHRSECCDDHPKTPVARLSLAGWGAKSGVRYQARRLWPLDSGPDPHHGGTAGPVRADAKKINYSSRSDTLGFCLTADHRWSATQPGFWNPKGEFSGTVKRNQVCGQVLVDPIAEARLNDYDCQPGRVRPDEPALIRSPSSTSRRERAE